MIEYFIKGILLFLSKYFINSVSSLLLTANLSRTSACSDYLTWLVHMQTYILYIGIHCFKSQLIASINYLALWQLIHYYVLHIVPLHFHNKHVSNQSRSLSYRNEIQFVYSIFWQYSCGVYYFGYTHVETWLGRYI